MEKSESLTEKVSAEQRAEKIWYILFPHSCLTKHWDKEIELITSEINDAVNDAVKQAEREAREVTWGDAMAFHKAEKEHAEDKAYSSGYKAGYTAGAEAMREKCAAWTEENCQFVECEDGCLCAKEIRALKTELNAPTGGKRE